MKAPVPARPAGQVRAEVRFTYDTSGLLEVDLHVPDSGLNRNLVIVDEDDKRSQKDIAKSRKTLERLKIHPRDEAENVALLTRAERAYEGFIGAERDIIGQALTGYKGALEKQDPRLIAEARDALVKLLDHLVSTSPL